MTAGAPDPLRATASRVVEALRGQCVGDFEATCEDLGVATSEALEREVMAEVFLCEECGWWCLREEEAGDAPGVCDDCVEWRQDEED